MYTHYIHCEGVFDYLKFNEKLFKYAKGLIIKEITKHRFNYSIEGQTTCGVEFLFQDNIIKVINPYSSSDNDLILTNMLVKKILLITNIKISNRFEEYANPSIWESILQRDNLSPDKYEFYKSLIMI